MVKAIALLSGGLDSTLAVKLVSEQGIEVWAVNFVTPFCTCTKKGCQNQAKRIADQLGINLKIVALKEEYIELVKNPKHGYGKNMNPCIDCRILLFSKARDYMNEIGASFIFTGEVLGERPMSQHLVAMKTIERESGLEGKILRPLCAKHLEPTLSEISGVVDRSQFLGIRGRSRKIQMALAEEYGIVDYPCPAGGCRLTDPNYAKRIKDAFEHSEGSLKEIILLSYGRHFRLSTGAKLIVGRNESENKIIREMSDENDLILEVLDYPGPTALLRKQKDENDIMTAAGSCVAYSDFTGKGLVKVKVGGDEIFAVSLAIESLNKLRVN